MEILKTFYCRLMNSKRDGRRANQRPHNVVAVISLALAGSLWGTGFLFGKIAFQEMSVSEDVSYRFATASIFLLPILLRRWRPFLGKDLLFLLLASVVGIPVQYIIQFEGLHRTTVSHASLIVGSIPVLLAAMSAVTLKERLHFFEWTALIMSACGAVLIAFSARASSLGPRPDWRGDLLVLLSLFAGVGMILCTKQLIRSHDALHVTAATIIIGTCVLLVWSELTQPLRFQFSLKVWGAALAQGFLATAAAYLFWNWGLSQVPAARAGVFLNLEPVVGATLGVVILHERLGSMAIFGGMMIIAAAIYFSMYPHQG